MKQHPPEETRASVSPDVELPPLTEGMHGKQLVIDLWAANRREAMRRPEPIRLTIEIATDVETKLVAPSPELPDETEINDLTLPLKISTVLNKAGFRTVGEVRKTPDADLLGYPRLTQIRITYLRKTLG